MKNTKRCVSFRKCKRNSRILPSCLLTESLTPALWPSSLTAWRAASMVWTARCFRCVQSCGWCWITPSSSACAGCCCVYKTQKVLLTTYPPFSLIPFHQLQEVFRLFDNANCPSLQNKPKMFFIQACRGGECPAGRAPGWRLLGSLPPALIFLFAPLRC